MGYFSNGTEGMAYQEAYCERCVHWPKDPADGGCAVWLAHLMRNYDDCNDKRSVLHVLIPRSEDGLRNEQCKLFHERREPETDRLFI